MGGSWCLCGVRMKAGVRMIGDPLRAGLPPQVLRRCPLPQAARGESWRPGSRLLTPPTPEKNKKDLQNLLTKYIYL